MSTPTPSALLVPLPNPGGVVPTGGQIGATYAFGATNYSVADSGASIDLPSLFATFPLSGGGVLTVYFPPTVQTLSGPGWWSPATATQSVDVSTTGTFAAGSAVLSSQKIAVMASEEYGNLTLEFRWHWTVAYPGSGPNAGAWSQPTYSANWPSSVPSIFFPAPFVGLVRTTPNPAVIGSDYTMWISGHVPGRPFLIEVEDPVTGQVSQAQKALPPTNAPSPAAVGVVLINYDGYLYPGTYLAHLHDGCGALLYSVTVQAVYAKSAIITFDVKPSGCGPIVFNQSTYASGSTASVRPSATPYTFSVPSCAGYRSAGWTTSGGLHIVDATHLLVSASGSVTFQYR